MARSSLTILIAGTGRLAQVLAQASLKVSTNVVAIFGRNHANRDALVRDQPNLQPAEPEWVARADIVVLAVPPQAYQQVLASLTPHLDRSTVVVSVTNGVALDDLRLWTTNPIVKVIPTIAQAVGHGAVPVVAGPSAQIADIELVKAWLNEFSLPVEVQEEDIRVASNVAGSAIAAFAMFAHAFASANVVQAKYLSPKTIDMMIAESLGAVAQLLRAGYDYKKIVDNTATPSGVTEALLHPLSMSTDAICSDMVEASIRRQSELQGRQIV